jgi:hypothetical protein
LTEIKAEGNPRYMVNLIQLPEKEERREGGREEGREGGREGRREDVGN